jgi:hypothetical protein
VNDYQTNNALPYWQKGSESQLVSSTVYYDPVNRRLGIGLANPLYTLDVDGDGYIRRALTVTGSLETLTDQLWVMGTNIITNSSSSGL